ncbi:MAG: hypothetical protein U9Q06_02005 [Nanoarchaeota archaeon]|nr:hypothetical protein [Nanoarchaeota archaeon]
MKRKSRKWFNLAYKCTEGVIPFGILTGPNTLDDLRKVFGADSSDEELLEIRKILNDFYMKIPSEEDFVEEKQRVLTDLPSDLHSIFPYASTAIYFGSIIGDLDIGLITEQKINEDKLIKTIRENTDTVRKYPLVDWEGILYFCSMNGLELSSRIAKSRVQTTGKKLDTKERQYVRETILGAQVLWGDYSELEKMREVFNVFE